MIVDVLVTLGLRIDALAQHLLHGVIHKTLVPTIIETLGQPTSQSEVGVHLARKQYAPVAGEGSARKIRHDFAPTQVLKEQRLLVTLCYRRSGERRFHWAE